MRKVISDASVGEDTGRCAAIESVPAPNRNSKKGELWTEDENKRYQKAIESCPAEFRRRGKGQQKWQYVAKLMGSKTLIQCQRKHYTLIKQKTRMAKNECAVSNRHSLPTLTVPELLAASNHPPMYPAVVLAPHPVGGVSGLSIFERHRPDTPQKNTIAHLLHSPPLIEVIETICSARLRKEVEKRNHAVLLASLARVPCSSEGDAGRTPAKTPPLLSQGMLGAGCGGQPAIEPSVQARCRINVVVNGDPPSVTKRPRLG